MSPVNIGNNILVINAIIPDVTIISLFKNIFDKVGIIKLIINPITPFAVYT